jgi:hypothetical protein
VSEAEEKNKAMTHWWWEEVWVKGNVAATDEFMAANYVDHPGLPGLPPGREGAKQALANYRTAFPAMQATVDDILAEGDRGGGALRGLVLRRKGDYVYRALAVRCLAGR